MKKNKSTAQKMIDVGQWIVIIAFVLGVIVAFVAGVWIAFEWLMKTTVGISVLELCSRAGLIGEITLILLPFGIIAGLWIMLYGMPCMDMC